MDILGPIVLGAVYIVVESFKYFKAKTVRRAVSEAARLDDLSDTQLVRVGSTIGMDPSEIRAILSEQLKPADEEETHEEL